MIYFAGQQVAQRVVSGSVVSYYFSDQVGSVRLMVDATANPCWDADYYPFGGSNIFGTINCQPQYRYTLMETEPTMSNDDEYAMYRYYSHRFARFMSPDPIGGNPANPQSWNRYAYVANNPLVFTDPLGLCFAALIDEDGNTVACYDPAGGPLVGGNMFADPPLIWIGGWPGWLGGGGWPGGGGGWTGGGSGFLPGDEVPWWDMPVTPDPLTSYLWSLTNFVLFGTPIDFTQFASPTLDATETGFPSPQDWFKEQFSNCYNGFHKTRFGRVTEQLSLPALFPIAHDWKDNQLQLGAEYLYKLAMASGSNSAGGLFAGFLKTFSQEVSAPLFLAGTGVDTGAAALCAGNALHSPIR